MNKIKFIIDVSNIMWINYWIVKKINGEDFDAKKFSNYIQLKALNTIKHIVVNDFGLSNTSNIFFCFDDTSFRYLVREDYKGSRESSNNIYGVLANFHKYLNSNGINNLKILGLEADDLITLVCEKFKDDIKIIISADNDLKQLVNSTTAVLIPLSGSKALVTDGNFSGTKPIHLKHKIVDPKYILLEKILKGCKTDNIQGLAPKRFRVEKIDKIANSWDANIESLLLTLQEHFPVDEKSLKEQLSMVCLKSQCFPQIFVDEFNKTFSVKNFNERLFL